MTNGGSFKKRNIIIILSVLIIIIGAGSGFYYFDRVKPYQNLISSADKAVAADNFDSAINLYTQAETYRKNFDINKKIDLLGTLKISKSNYEKADNKMKNKEYIDGINLFKKVDKRDSKRYTDSKNKINECKKLYVSDNLSKARSDLKAGNFDGANKYIACVFKVESDNKEAESLKNDITKDKQDKEEKDNIERQAAAAKIDSVSENQDDYTSQMAIKLAMEKDNLKNSPDLLIYCDNIPLYDSNGKKYYWVFFKNRIYVEQGGSGTIDNLIIAKDGSICGNPDEVSPK